MRSDPVGTVLRRGYYEVVHRTLPERLERLHRSPVRWTHYRIRVPLNEAVGKSLFLYGVYEPIATAVFSALLSDGDVAIDVGAHLGDFTFVAAAKVGPSGAVYAFEPQDSVRRILTDNLASNKITNVIPLDCALADVPGVARLYDFPDPAATAQASLSSLQVGQSSIYTEVTVSRLDDVIAEDDRHRVAALKIDVEGSEALVLRGATSLLASAKPAVIFEVNGLSTDGGFTCEAFVALYDAGYVLHGMRPATEGFRIKTLTRGEDPSPCREPWLALNLLALAPGSLAEERLRRQGRFC